MRRYKKKQSSYFTVLFVGILSFVAEDVQASKVVFENASALALRAQSIVVGMVVRQRVRQEYANLMRTDYEVRVLQAHKGAFVVGERVQISLPGGKKTGSYVQRVVGVPFLQEKRMYLFFLEENKNLLIPVRLSEGIWPIEINPEKNVQVRVPLLPLPQDGLLQSKSSSLSHFHKPTVELDNLLEAMFYRTKPAQ